MKLAHISRLLTSVLVMTIAGFIGVSGMFLNRLSTDFKSVDAFSSLKARVALEVNLPVSKYLATGDAALLSQVEHNIQILLEHINREEHLKQSEQEVIQALLQDFERKVVVDLRAAGKLADPMVLVMNNEKQLMEGVSALQQYADQSTVIDDVFKQKHMALSEDLKAGLQVLAVQRKIYFSETNATQMHNVNEHIEKLMQIINRLEELPALEIFETQQQDESELDSLLGWADEDEEQLEDKGKRQLEELAQLTRRYPKELGNVANVLQTKQRAKELTQQNLVSMKEKMEQFGVKVSRSYSDTEKMLYVAFAVSVLFLILVNVVFSLLNHRFSLIINKISHYLNQVALGDLTAGFEEDSKMKEVRVLRKSASQLKEYFVTLVNKIDSETQTLHECQTNVFNGTQQMESVVADQQQLSVISAEQMKQLSNSFKDVAEKAAETRNATASTHANIENGVSLMNSTCEQVGELSSVMDTTASSLQDLQQDAKEIEGVLGVIEGFTAQTNLLALNAAIEAARAGEHGRGFAVVADEVRSLATQIANSAGEIHQLIETFNQATRQTVELMHAQQDSVKSTTQSVEEVNEVFSSIYEAIANISEKNTMIATSAEQQSAVAIDISKGIIQTAESSDITLEEAQKNKESANRLVVVSDNLKQLVQQFSLVNG